MSSRRPQEGQHELQEAPGGPEASDRSIVSDFLASRSYFDPPGRLKLERELNVHRFSCFSLVFWPSGKAKTRARAQFSNEVPGAKI